jgi:CHAT domain-containing protein
VLRGDDARQAAELEQKVAALRRAGEYTEAQQAAQSLLALRTRLQGAGHWQTADARRLLETVEKAAALPEEARAELAEAIKLDGEVFKLYRGGRYADALPLLKRALDLRRRHLGAEHPEVVKALNDLAFFLQQAGRYADAEPLHREALAIKRKTLGPEHPSTATSLNNLGMNLLERGLPGPAETPLREALAIRRKMLGEEDADTASSYNNVALSLDAQGKYAAAEGYFRTGLAICRRVLGEQHPYTATSYNNVASVLDAQGKYARAEPLCRTALALRRELLGERHPDTANSYSNLASNLALQGEYAQAEPLYRQAVAIYSAVLGKNHPNTATALSNLAYDLRAQEKWTEAEPLLLTSLAIKRQVLGEEHPDTARAYNNLAANLQAQGRTAQAEPLARRGLAIRRKVLGEAHPDTAQSYTNLAALLDALDRHAEAEPLARRGLAIRRQVLGEEHPDTGRGYNNLANNLNAQGKYAAAEPYFRKALALWSKGFGEAHPNTALGYHNLAYTLYAEGKYGEAEATWRSATRSFEAARLRVSFAGLDRAAFAEEHSPLPGLTVCLARNGKATEAHRYWEAALARGLLDDLSARLARRLSEREQHRQQELLGKLQLLDKQVAALLPARDRTEAHGRQLDQLQQERDAALLDLKQFEAELAQRHGPAAGQVYELARIQAPLPPDAALLSWVDVQGRPQAADPNGDHWACLVRHCGEPVWVKLPGTGPRASWTEEDDELPGRFRLAVGTVPGKFREDGEAIARQLYGQRLAPLARHLAASDDLPAVRHLIVLPSPALSGVPVEALAEARTDRQPAYTVSYAPSGTLFAWLQEQKQQARAHGQPADPPRLLALGDPVFAPAQKGKAAFARLPGTRREVEAVARLFDRADRLLGSAASEQQLDQLATTGRLQQYPFLHLATHGVLNPQVALHSALILSQDHLPDPLAQVLAGQRAYDGRLTAAQILRTWKLDAELVTLSACQSGLGQYQGGEGYLGFAQALLLAGGRSLVLSQWPVEDNATALLMTRFYQNLLGKRAGLKGPLPKAEALCEAKRWLRELPAEEVQKLVAALPGGSRGETRAPASAAGSVKPYAHPYYWAAFILIGDPQ